MGIIYLGNFIEFLEFILFASLLPFFSQDVLMGYDPHIKAHLGYFLVYVGFIGRPVGAFYLGKWGDRYGARPLLLLSVLGISLATFMTPFILHLPYGIAGLIVIRFLQGVFTGSEQAAATVYVQQKGPKGYYPFSILTASGIAGVMVAQTLVFSLQALNIHKEWWTYSFWIVSALGALTFWLRFKKLNSFASSVIEPSSKDHLRHYKPQLVTGILVCGFVNAMFYFIGLFINNYKMILSGNMVTGQFLLGVISSLTFIITILLWGGFFRKGTLNPVKNLIIAFVGTMVVLPFVFYTYVYDSSFIAKIFSQTALVGLVQLVTIVGIPYIVQQFPSSIQVQATGICMGIGSGLMGGCVPLVASLLTSWGDSLWTPLYFIYAHITFALSFLIWTATTHKRNPFVWKKTLYAR